MQKSVCLCGVVCAMVQYSATHRHVGPIRSGRSEKQGPSAPRQSWASDKCWDRQSRKTHHVYQIATNHAVIRLSPYLIECTRNMLLMICRGTRYDGIVRITSSHAKNNQRHENATDQINRRRTVFENSDDDDDLINTRSV